MGLRDILSTSAARMPQLAAAPLPIGQREQALLATFDRWRQQNAAGGLPVRWRRRRVWFSQLQQKLGRHVEAAAPLFFGEDMRVVTGEIVSRSLLTFGYSEVAVTALMLHVLQSGDTVVDIGAHFGYEALLAAHIVGRSGRVTSFEPHPVTARLARRNLTRFPQCELRAQALGAAPGKLRLGNQPIERSAFNKVEADGSSENSVDVPVTTLDAAFPAGGSRVKFIKCDAEGFELPIIEGGRRLLLENSPAIVLEADIPALDGTNSPRAFELCDRLRAIGYVAYNFDYDQRLRIAPLGEMRVHHANVLFLPQSRPELGRLLGVDPSSAR